MWELLKSFLIIIGACALFFSFVYIPIYFYLNKVDKENTLTEEQQKELKEIALRHNNEINDFKLKHGLKKLINFNW